MDEVKAWQSRTLEPVYPIVYLDCIHVKVRDTGAVRVKAVYTNKAPGGVAYRCSFRVTEAVHLIERLTDIMAHQLGRDPADLRPEGVGLYVQRPGQPGQRR